MSVMLATGNKVAKLRDASSRSYLPIGRLGEFPLHDALLRRLPGISEPGAIAFKDAFGRDIHLPPSFGGPAHVRDALGKERGSCAAVQRRIEACDFLEPGRSRLLQARPI